jgi:hypothetical protein
VTHRRACAGGQTQPFITSSIRTWRFAYALRDLSLTSFPPLRFPTWQREYESVLLEADKSVLFKRVEVAEAAILTRRDALEHDSSSQTERSAIEGA